jgi:predicted HTH transcriptional regulator
VEKTVEKLLFAIKNNKHITIKELQEITWLKRRWIEYNLKKLKNDWKIWRVWPDKWGHWEITSPQPSPLT